jgi:hypothetical protein
VSAKPAETPAPTTGYLLFDVRLNEIRPVIVRRFLLSRTSTFRDLHDAIQDSFGWGDVHGWLFYTNSLKPPIAGPPDEEDFVQPRPDARKVKLTSFFGEGRAEKCRYAYDLGDYWEHEVRYAGIVRKEGRFRRELLSGARAGPPEDCGGIGGYEQCVMLVLGKLRTSAAEKKEMKEWLGDWDPERFELKEAKQQFDR